MSDLETRLTYLKDRLRTAYDGIGHSHGRPYIYLVYPPEQERKLRRLVDNELQSDADMTFYHLDVLTIIIESTADQEARREELLNNPLKAGEAKRSLVRMWSRRVGQAITRSLEQNPPAARPVVVLRGLAALHPLGSPTAMMEELAEHEPRAPTTGQIVPIVLLTPGVRPPQTSRTYYFLGQEDLRQEFYRGEEL
ncbi:MAG: hypothetical protein MI924_04425 [Chloroflexales bacterium]|nr:hypothetical protein [Chloroflexales bacterium]